MPINVLINGAFGRMGQMTVKAINQRPIFALVGQTGREYDLKKSIQDSGAQVVIDFTLPESVFSNTKTILEAGARPVIGTSGLTAEQVSTLQTLAAELKLGGVVAPNFSLGGVLMMKYAREIAKHFPDVEIIELHHAGKVDSPSGTAMRSAELIAEACQNVNATAVTGRENVPHARGASYRNIPIHSIRLPGLLAHQTIIFGGEGETLSIQHDSLNRECFMPGVCFACEKVMSLNSLVYGLENLL